jgi:D-alanyl-D-alanine carboxypeptidase
MKLCRIFAGALVLTACSTGVSADVPAELAATAEAWRERTPAPAVVMAVAGPAVGEHLIASGTLHREGEQPVTISTPFRVASITKMLVASVALQLVEEGRLSLDDSVSSLASSDEAKALEGLLDGVRVRDLLGHTSGLPDSARSPQLVEALQTDPDVVWTAGEVFNLVSKSQREFAPGTAFGYSNTNYLLLGEVIEGVTRNAWWEETRTRILNPLEMVDSYMAGFERAEGTLAPGYFDMDNDGFTEELKMTWPALETTEGAAGALVSTVSDLLRLAEGVFKGKLVRAATLEQMTTPGAFSSRYTGYGLGIEILKPDLETTVWGHRGFVPGYRAVLWHAPVPDLTVIVLTNESRSRPDGLAELALRIASP